jgi:hypothetical protein
MSGYPPIYITNALPGLPYLSSNQAVASLMPCLDIASFLDTAVEAYSDWQQSRVRREDQKDEIRKLCDIALDHGLDLQQLYDDQDPDFFVKQGIKVGIARRFIRDIGLSQHRLRAVREEFPKIQRIGEARSYGISCSAQGPLHLLSLPPIASQRHI